MIWGYVSRFIGKRVYVKTVAKLGKIQQTCKLFGIFLFIICSFLLSWMVFPCFALVFCRFLLIVYCFFIGLVAFAVSFVTFSVTSR